MNFSALETYTMTCTCSTAAVAEDLEQLAATMPLAADSVGVVSVKSPSGRVRGASSKKPSKGAFGHHMSVTTRVVEQRRPIHVKLFRTGSMQIAGALSTEAAYAAALSLCRLCGLEDPVDLSVRMINSGMRCSERLDMAACLSALRAAGIVTEYDPSRYAAVKASLFFAPDESAAGVSCLCTKSCATKRPKHRWCQMVTVAIFDSGAIGISGGSCWRHILRSEAIVKETLSRAGRSVIKLDACAMRDKLMRMASEMGVATVLDQMAAGLKGR
jgi:hypothetical protein